MKVFNGLSRNTLSVAVALCLTLLPRVAGAAAVATKTATTTTSTAVKPITTTKTATKPVTTTKKATAKPAPVPAATTQAQYAAAPKKQASSKVYTATPPTGTGTWSHQSFNATKSDSLTMGSNYQILTVSTDEQATVKLNGLENWTKKVVPVLAEQGGLDHMFIHEELSSGTLQAQDWFSGNWKNCVKYDVSADITVELPLDSNDVTAQFASSKKLLTDWDLDESYLAVTVETHLENGSDSGNVFCVGWNLLNAITGDTRSTVSADDFDGSLDATINEVVNSVVSVDQIDAITLDFTGITLLNSQAFTWLTNAVLTVGDTVDDLFGNGFACSTVDSCVSDLVTDQVQEKSVKNQIVAAINDAMEYTATVEGKEDAGRFDLDYAVGLSTITTSASDTMSVKWDVDVAGDFDSCASQMQRGHYYTSNAAETNDDIDVKLPFPLVDKAVFEVGQTGAFCESVTETQSVYGIPVTMTGDIVPSGALDIKTSPSILSDDGAYVMEYDDAATQMQMMQMANDANVATYEHAERVDVGAVADNNDNGGSVGEASANDLEKIYITVPAKLQNIAVNGNVVGGAALTLDIEIEAEIGLGCTNGLFLRFTRAAAGPLSGSFSTGGTTYDGDDFQGAVDDAMEDILDDLGLMSLIPKVNNLQETGELGIELGNVNVDNEGMHVGLNIVSEDVCAGTGDGGESEDDDGEVAIDGPGGGGTDNTPNLELLDDMNHWTSENTHNNTGNLGGLDQGAAQVQGAGF